jgi:hypothetical protein
MSVTSEERDGEREREGEMERPLGCKREKEYDVYRFLSFFSVSFSFATMMSENRDR